MYNINNADQLRQKKREKDPNYERKLLDKIKQYYPEHYAHYVHEEEYGRHIGDKDTYKEAVNNLNWKQPKDGRSSGPMWDADDLAEKSHIDFDERDFDKYDYAYTVNRLYADNNNAYTESSGYMKMAENYLTDYNYHHPGERAYEDMKRRMRYTRRDRDNDGRYNE